MRLGIAYLTARAEPELPWLLTGLAQQMGSSDEIDLVVVDARARSLSELGAADVPRGVRAILIRAPRSDGAWAKASAGNAAIVAFPDGVDYVAFLDDRCWLGATWLEAVRLGYGDRQSVLAGSYARIVDGVIEDDHRRELAPEGRRDCGGGWLFGCTFALPLAWLLEVNGFEDGCDGIGAEDSVLGAMLENGGRRIDFQPALHVWLERSSSAAHGLIKRDKELGEACVARYGSRWRTLHTPDLAALRRDRAVAADLSRMVSSG